MKKAASLEKSTQSRIGKRQVSPSDLEEKSSGNDVKLSPDRKNMSGVPSRSARTTSSGGQRVPVRLSIYQPRAHEVFVAGAFNEWNPSATPMRSSGDGSWYADLRLEPGSYEYRFVVDSQWMDDPAAVGQTANPFGGMNSVITVTASRP